jgi:hypothetical protein
VLPRLSFTVIDIRQFKNLRLHGGFIIKDIALTDDPIVDASPANLDLLLQFHGFRGE